MKNLLRWIIDTFQNRGLPGVLVCLFKKDQNAELELLLVRSTTSPHFFHFPSGFINPLEDPLNAALRELEEETSIALDSLITTPYKHSFTYPMVPFHPRSVQRLYVSEVSPGTSSKPDHEIIESRWCSITEAKKLVYPELNIIIDQALLSIAK
ncbi:MAG: NUDIX domain-containing protein [Candidatus Saccharimonadales bacterium]